MLQATDKPQYDLGELVDFMPDADQYPLLPDANGHAEGRITERMLSGNQWLYEIVAAAGPLPTSCFVFEVDINFSITE